MDGVLCLRIGLFDYLSRVCVSDFRRDLTTGEMGGVDVSNVRN